MQEKKRLNLLEFSDMERMTLSLLEDENGAPTALATEMKAQFDEVFIDEYQDVNDIQNRIFIALSSGNRFLVGDVKQSIYGFRQAMPFRFTKRRDDYRPYREQEVSYPATITLKNNFRSRAGVTDTTNFIFRQLMNECFGGVTYGENDELKHSATYYPEADRPAPEAPVFQPGCRRCSHAREKALCNRDFARKGAVYPHMAACQSDLPDLRLSDDAADRAVFFADPPETQKISEMRKDPYDENRICIAWLCQEPR